MGIQIAYFPGCSLHSSAREYNDSIKASFGILGVELKEVPDVLCSGGWWPSDSLLSEKHLLAGYYGISNSDIILSKKRLLGKSVEYFSSSHERSHLLCAFGMSNLPKGTPCYALLWEGVIGSFYKIGSELNLTKIGDVMPEPGHRYALLYGLADQTFDKNVAEFSRFSDAGKLMALASLSERGKPSEDNCVSHAGLPASETEGVRGVKTLPALQRRGE